MTTQLQGTDVVIVGMGAAGGVAALPLAEAGLNVVGLEAGTWLDQRDFAPDEIRNNYRDWPMLVKKTESRRIDLLAYDLELGFCGSIDGFFELGYHRNKVLRRF